MCELCVIMLDYSIFNAMLLRLLIYFLPHCVGVLIFALPVFVFGTYSTTSTSNTRPDLCSALSLQQLLDLQAQANNGTGFTPPVCDMNDSDRYSLIFFFIGNILIGRFHTSLYYWTIFLR